MAVRILEMVADAVETPLRAVNDGSMAIDVCGGYLVALVYVKARTLAGASRPECAIHG